MGCDIHLSVEIKVKGVWLHYNRPYIHRNYYLFCMMAGVRQYNAPAEPKPISQPRGLPTEPISDVTSFLLDYDGPDAHSVSWLSAEEAGKVQGWWSKDSGLERHHPPLFGYLFGNAIDSYIKYPEDGSRLKERGYEDARLVFWFDN